ncbi:MAG: hypothetical protein IH606_18530 [Burkholderiales bacterium]|nr:hypothetical protein [Burkholderiales bacterium]
MEEQPRLALLRDQVLKLPVSEPARKMLLQSIEYFRGHLRPDNSRRGRRLATPDLRHALKSGISDRVMHERYR